MKKFFKIIFTTALFLVMAACSPQSGGGASEEAVIMEPDTEGSLPAPMYPLSVGRAVSSDATE